MYYIAYGSNMNIEQMSQRCPGSVKVGTVALSNHRLVFRKHATIEVAYGYHVPVVVWKITARDEAVLDIYEGVPRYYRKEYILLKINGKVHDALVYIMNGSGQSAPAQHYYDVIKDGYESAGIDIKVLEKALTESTERSTQQ